MPATNRTTDDADDQLRVVLFLDVDGVLNRCGKSGHGLETDKVAHLKRIVDAANPTIVISSTWRLFERPMQRLLTMIDAIGGRFGGATPTKNERPNGGLCFGTGRGQEIQKWMDENGTPERFAILDDDSDMAHLLPHLFRTKSFVGLTDEITGRVIEALR